MNLRESLSYTPNELQFGTSGLRGLLADMTDLECYINVRGFMAFVSQQAEPFQTVYVSGDLRKSTPRIMQIVAIAITDSGYNFDYCDRIPTPALAYYAAQSNSPAIMVTGSHIPDDRNGIKFYKQTGEVLKSDESAIQVAVAGLRSQLYEQAVGESLFDETGTYKKDLPELSATQEAYRLYIERYKNVFGSVLSGKEIVLYQHSAVGRDLMVELYESLGATVVCEGRSEVFIPIDTENIKPQDSLYFQELAQKHSSAFAIISTDGDGDRPFLIDETGTFHRGDVIGIYTATFLGADAVALPVSTNNAADIYLSERKITVQKTRIGSPYVIDAMTQLSETHTKVSGWEVNGGFLLGTDTELSGKVLTALPTRDAIIPQLACMAEAIKQNISLSSLFAQPPKRYTQAGLIDNFPVEVSIKLVETLGSSSDESQGLIKQVFNAEAGFGSLSSVDATDGVRMSFDGGDIVHIRPSGNAPQLRVYTNCDSQERADAIVASAIAEPNGYLRQLEKLIAG